MATDRNRKIPRRLAFRAWKVRLHDRVQQTGCKPTALACHSGRWKSFDFARL